MASRLRISTKKYYAKGGQNSKSLKSTKNRKNEVPAAKLPKGLCVIGAKNSRGVNVRMEILVILLVGMIFLAGCAGSTPNNQPAASNLAPQVQTPQPATQQPAPTATEKDTSPKPLLKLQDITVSQNDNRGALLEISSTELNDKASTPVLIGMMKGDSYTLSDGAAINLNEMAMGYTLTANWVKISIGTDSYFINKGESITHGKERIKFVETTLDQSTLYATVRSGTLSKNLSRGESFTVNGKGIKLQNIHIGNTMNVLLIELVSDGKTYYVPINNKTQINSGDVYFDSFGFNSNLVDASSQKNKKIFFEVYGSDGKLTETIKMAVGETRQIGNNQVQYLAYSEGCTDDFTAECKKASLDISGKKSKMKVGDVQMVGDIYLKVADFEMSGEGAYASLMLFEKDGKEYLLKKLGDGLTLPNGETATITDIRRGINLGKKEIKLTVGGRDSVIEVGEFLCSNYEVATDESSCYSSSFKGTGIVITQSVMANAKTTDKCSDGTAASTCAINKPKYCNSELMLVDNLQSCGCPASCDDGQANTLDTCDANTNYECQHKTFSSEELSKNAISPSYTDLFKNPSSYSGKYIKYIGVVLQSQTGMLRVAVNGNSNQVIYVVHTSGENFKDSEYVEVVGLGGQNIKYTAVFGNEIEIPQITAISVRSLPFAELPKHALGDSVMIDDNTVLRVLSQRVRPCEVQYHSSYISDTNRGYYMTLRVEFSNPGTQGESSYISSSYFTLLDSAGRQYKGTYYYSYGDDDTCNDLVELESGSMYPGVSRSGNVVFEIGKTVGLANPLKIVYGNNQAVYEFSWK